MVSRVHLRPEGAVVLIWPCILCITMPGNCSEKQLKPPARKERGKQKIKPGSLRAGSKPSCWVSCRDGFCNVKTSMYGNGNSSTVLCWNCMAIKPSSNDLQLSTNATTHWVQERDTFPPKSGSIMCALRLLQFKTERNPERKNEIAARGGMGMN